MAVVPPSTPPEQVPAPESLLDVGMRFWVELGRSRMPVASAVALSSGAIVDLDRAPDDPVDVYVNGRHFGSGRLLQVDGEWAVRLESLTASAEPAEAEPEAPAEAEVAAEPEPEAPAEPAEPAEAEAAPDAETAAE